MDHKITCGADKIWGNIQTGFKLENGMMKDIDQKINDKKWKLFTKEEVLITINTQLSDIDSKPS